MVIIQVVFPQSGKPILVPQEARCRPGGMVVWQVTSLNVNVRKVAIEFADAAHTFFDGAPASGQKDLDGKLYSADDPLQGMLDGAILGRAMKGQKGIECKYALKSWDASGLTLGIDLDPKIIIDEP